MSPQELFPEHWKELIDKEYVIWNDEMQKSGKPKEIWDKILTGKDRKLFEVDRIKLDVLKSELILGIN